MKDLKYIFKRIIIGVAIALILMLIKSNVFAATSRNYEPTGAWGYEIDSNTYVNIINSKTSVQSGGNVYYWRFESPKPKIRLSYPSWNDETGYYDLFFSLYGRSEETNSVILQLSSGYYNCDVKSNSYNDPNATNDFNYNTGSFQTVSCYNIPMVSSGYFTIYIIGSRSSTSGGSASYIYISKVITNIKKESVSQAINDQSSQQHTDSQNTQNAINDVNDSITSSNTPSSSDTSSAYSSFDNATAQNGVITSLITLPIQLFTNINNNINSSCTRFDMGTLLGTHIYFNCIQPQNYIGSQLWSVIDILMSGFFVWYIGKKLIKVFENLSSMKEGDPVGD